MYFSTGALQVTAQPSEGISSYIQISRKEAQDLEADQAQRKLRSAPGNILVLIIVSVMFYQLFLNILRYLRKIQLP